MVKNMNKWESSGLPQSSKPVDNTSISLLKALVNAGIGSRRRIADAIRQGMVEVNCKVIEDFRYLINMDTDCVSIGRKSIDIKPGKLVYLMLNKPRGVTSTTCDERGRRTVVDILPEKYRHMRLYPVGRLDKDSTRAVIRWMNAMVLLTIYNRRFDSSIQKN